MAGGEPVTLHGLSPAAPWGHSWCVSPSPSTQSCLALWHTGTRVAAKHKTAMNELKRVSIQPTEDPEEDTAAAAATKANA